VTADEARGRPDTFWKERADRGSRGEDQVTVIAVEGSRTIGMAVGLVRSSPPTHVVPIISVFVSPSARKSGVGTKLVGAVESWAREVGGSVASLWVVESNHVAIGLYESLGYVQTQDRQLIMAPPIRWETRYEKCITGAR